MRRVLRIKASFYSRISNEEVWKRAKTVPLSDKLLTQQLKYLGHVMRAEHTDPIYFTCFNESLHYRTYGFVRRRGRPKEQWADELIKLVAQRSNHTATPIRATPHHVSRAAQDRTSWAVRCRGPTARTTNVSAMA